MNYNPYAAPQAAPPSPAGAPQHGGGPQPWEIGEVLSAAFDAFKVNWAVLVLSYFLVYIIGMIPGQLPTILVATGAVDNQSAAYWGVFSGSTLVGILIQTFFQVGLLKIWLASARGGQANFAELFSGGSRYLPLLATTFLVGFIVGLGFVLLIVPGLILMVGLGVAQLYVVDAGLGPIEGMKASWEATKGQRLMLFLFAIVLVLIAVAGVLACCVGIFATVPLAGVAGSTVYLRISGRGGPPAPAQLGGYPPPPPPGQYGPPGGGYGGPPPGGGYGPPGGGYGGPPPGGGYGPQGGGGGYGPQGGGGGYGPQGGGGGGYGPQGGGGGYGPQGGGYGPQGGGGGYGPQGGGPR
jgi:hypothetical protein